MTDTYTDRVFTLLRQSKGRWVDGMTIAKVGGSYSWRTRISDARRQYHVQIENRQRRVGKRVVSEYRLAPARRKAA